MEMSACRPFVNSLNTLKKNHEVFHLANYIIFLYPGNYRTSAPYMYTEMTNTTVANNDQGIVTRHYNNPSNKRLELFMRHKREHIYFKVGFCFNT